MKDITSINFWIIMSYRRSLFASRRTLTFIPEIVDFRGHRIQCSTIRFSGFGALHLARSESAVSSRFGGLLVSGDVPPPVRYRGVAAASRRPTNVHEVQLVRLGRAVDQSCTGVFSTESRESRFLGRRWSYSLQLLVRFCSSLIKNISLI